VQAIDKQKDFDQRQLDGKSCAAPQDLKAFRRGCALLPDTTSPVTKRNRRALCLAADTGQAGVWRQQNPESRASSVGLKCPPRAEIARHQAFVEASQKSGAGARREHLWIARFAFCFSGSGCGARPDNTSFKSFHRCYGSSYNAADLGKWLDGDIIKFTYCTANDNVAWLCWLRAGLPVMALQIEKLKIPSVLLVKPTKFLDRRGYFSEIYNLKAFAAAGIDCTFVQDNHSFSVLKGTVRGLHFQTPPEPQAKLVQVLRGAIFDVAVDLRRGSPTYGRWCSALLTAERGEQMFVPRGFAHGMCTVEPDTAVAYKVDGFYAPLCDAGLRWNDPDLSIEWPVEKQDVVMSEKDTALPFFRGFESPFYY
jgi:dTDP-4-dehydrorhamnose 3,5-epimerase